MSPTVDEGSQCWIVTGDSIALRYPGQKTYNKVIDEHLAETIQWDKHGQVVFHCRAGVGIAGIFAAHKARYESDLAQGFRPYGGICIISFNDLISEKTWQHKPGQVEGAARSLREYCAWIKKHVRAFAFVSRIDGQAWNIRDFATF